MIVQLEVDVEIDDNIAEDILLLNKKGYRTNYCCEGHVGENYSTFYVYFKENYNFKKVPDLFNIEIPKKRKSKSCPNQKDEAILRAKSVCSNEEYKNQVLKAFKEWVCSLEPIN